MRRLTSQSGQALIAAAFGLIALIGATGLAVDMGFLRYQKRLLQSAADSAALAGAAEINYGTSAQAAFQDSSLNGFTSGANNVTVTAVSIKFPPSYAGPAPNAVQVQITAIEPTFFMKIFGVNQTSITVTAKAVLGGNGAGNCLYTLGLGGGIRTTGGANITAPNCGIIDNQDLNNRGNITASSIGVHGRVLGRGRATPNPITGIVPAADPLAYLTRPPAGGCYPNGTGVLTGNGNATLFPGTYCDGISVSGGVNVTLQQGVYVVTGGGISFGGNGSVTGNGVTLYLGPTGGSMTFNGNQTINLSAPTADPYAGILLYQDPANNLAATLDGTNTSNLRGAVYFPQAALTINGAAGSTTGYAIVVAESLRLNGATLNLPANYSSLPAGSPVKTAVLVE